MKKSNMNINKNYTSLLQQIQANSESEKELLEEIKIILKDATEPKKDRFSQFSQIRMPAMMCPVRTMVGLTSGARKPKKS